MDLSLVFVLHRGAWEVRVHVLFVMSGGRSDDQESPLLTSVDPTRRYVLASRLTMNIGRISAIRWYR